jgi:hypothetical protein
VTRVTFGVTTARPCSSAFDVIELDGQDLRRLPIEQRTRSRLRPFAVLILLNEHYEGDGEIVFEHACKLGCEGIVAEAARVPYRSGGRCALDQGQKSATPEVDWDNCSSPGLGQTYTWRPFKGRRIDTIFL